MPMHRKSESMGANILKTKNRFKFRIWDKQEKKFVDNSSSLHCYSQWAIDPFTGAAIEYVGGLSNDEHGLAPTPDNGYIDFSGKKMKAGKGPRYIIQQWTGVLDSKKKEIYEGDVVMVDKGKSYESTYEVIFEDGRFSLIHAKREGDDYGVYTRHLETNTSNDIKEVIGNIFTNPELTK